MYRKAVGTAQNWFPGLREARNRFCHWLRSTVGLLHDGDLALIAHEPVLMVQRFHGNPSLEPMLASLGYVEVRPEGRGFVRGHTDSENMICMPLRRLVEVQAALAGATGPTDSPRLEPAR